MISSPQLARIRIPALVLLALMAFYLVNLSFVDAAKDYEDYEYEDDDDDDDDDVVSKYVSFLRLYGIW